MPFDSSSHDPMPEGHRRLLVLAEFLETKVPADHFNMNVWKCGTTACAAGWAGTIPEFVRAGYRCEAMGPQFAGSRGSAEALTRFFDISTLAATQFFAPSPFEHLNTPLSVAARIRSYVAEHSSARVA